MDNKKPQNIHDPIIIKIIRDLLIGYWELIMVLDNDTNEHIQSIGKDLRSNLKNLQKIVEIAESDLIIQKLTNSQDINCLIEAILPDMQNFFDRFKLGE
jgi:hypothetical protein